MIAKKQEFSENTAAPNLFADVSDLERTQTASLLKGLVSANSQTKFGLHHNFSDIHSIDDYRANVPLASYEDIRSWVERISEGETNVLTKGRVVAFFKTSGSLSKPKLIPVTTHLMTQKVKTFAAYWEAIYQDYPRTRNGKMVCNFADSSEPDTTHSTLPIYSESAFWAGRGRGLHSLDRWPLPREVRDIKDPHVRSYACARLLLQEDMSCIMCLNPSTLLFFCRIIQTHLESLAAGLETGSWGAENINEYDALNSAENSALSKHLRINSLAAQRLNTFKFKTETIKLKELWPSLDLLICWQSQVVQPYFKQLSPYIEGIAIRDYITQSSECMMAVPYQDQTSGGELAQNAHFFEFIPEENTTCKQPETRLAWQLEIGRRYEVVVSTGGGLYRYRMGDCVQVNGFKGEIPIIEFLYRLGKTSSMTGEKLTEHQVMQAAKVSTEHCQYGPEEFLCFPCTGELPHYSLILDFGLSDNSCESMMQWGAEFDLRLKEFNSEYADKCLTGRLGSLQLFKASAGQLRSHRFSKRAKGVSEEQVKSEVLNAELDLHEKYTNLQMLK